MYTAMQWRAGSDLQFLKNLKYDKLLCKIFFIMLDMDELLFIKHAHHLMKPSNFVGEGTCSFRWHPMINHKWSSLWNIYPYTIWLIHSQSWTIIEGATSLTRTSSLCYAIFWVPRMVGYLLGFASGTFPFDYSNVTHQATLPVLPANDKLKNFKKP